MVPVIALLGRPNVGKSTLFNKLTRTRDALVADYPGLTRDRIYGHAALDGRSFIVIDTGGLTEQTDIIDDLTIRQSFQAAEEADLVLLLVDAQQGLNARDEEIAIQLRKLGKNILLVINKIDSMNESIVSSEYYSLGLGEPKSIAATQGRGLKELTRSILDSFPVDENEQADSDTTKQQGMVFAVVGRPNVGKSTFINRLLGEERLVTYDKPGTTRDSIFVPLNYDGEEITMVDTAGVRRRGRIKQTVEKFSVIKTLQSIDAANVVIMMLDAREGIAEQDASLLGYIIERGRALVVAVNKWDRLEADKREEIRRQLDRKLGFTDYADTHFISALHGSGIFDVLDSATKAYHSAFRRFSTPDLNRLLEDMLTEHQPPTVHGRRIKLRYIHQGGTNPPRFIIHGNQTDAMPNSYRRYLINRIRKHLRLKGTPISVEFRGGSNPFAGRRNKLTPRQVKKRERVRSRGKR